jgi:putative sigma-54 modulation protein
VEITVTGRHMHVEDDVRQYIAQKWGRIARHFDGVVAATALLAGANQGVSVEFVIRAARGATLVASAEAPDVRAAIDAASDKVERQVTRFKEKLHEGQNRHKGKAVVERPEPVDVDASASESSPSEQEEE